MSAYWRGCLASSPLLLLVTAAALACGEKVKDGRQVRVSIVIILASETDTFVDKRLKGIAEEVKKLHPKLKGFKFEKLKCKSVKVGAAHKFELIEGQNTSITVQKAADKMDRIRLKVGPPAMGGITYETPCGKFLPIVTPHTTKKSEKLIIAIRVEPCKGK